MGEGLDASVKLTGPWLCETCIIAVLVKRLGGETVILPEELDEARELIIEGDAQMGFELKSA